MRRGHALLEEETQDDRAEDFAKKNQAEDSVKWNPYIYIYIYIYHIFRRGNLPFHYLLKQDQAQFLLKEILKIGNSTALVNATPIAMTLASR